MKKISLAVAGLLFSGFASAIQLTSSGLIPITGCDNLNEDVSINLTTGVVAGADCTASRVAFAACHTAGMLKSRSVGQKDVTTDVTDPVTGNVSQVTTTVSCTVGAADADCQSVPVTGAAVPSSTTNNGTVNSQYPGTGACSASVAESVAQGLQ